MEATLEMSEKALKMHIKEEKKIKLREANEPPKLSVTEEIGNSVTHGAGAVFAVFAMILLLIKSDTTAETIAAIIYGSSIFFMMLNSCLYHAFRSGSAIKRIWRRIDYSSIYFLIGGTFAPFYLVYYGDAFGITLFCVQWAIIAIGVAIVGIFGPAKWRALHFTMYFTIGWSGLIFLPDFYRNNLPLLWFILIGGAVYTLGMIPFAMKKKNSHFIWHFFVLSGAVIHWLGIYFFVY